MSISCCSKCTVPPVRSGFKDIQYIYDAFDAYESLQSGSSKDAALQRLKQALAAPLPRLSENTGAAEIRFRVDAITNLKRAGFLLDASTEDALVTFHRILSAAV